MKKRKALNIFEYGVESFKRMHAHGNSGNLRRERGRNWFGTLWNETDKNIVKTLNAKYLLISDDDHTEEGQLHWHCLILFENPRNKPPTTNAHWERPKNVIQARNYCLEKGPNYYEDGEMEIRLQNEDEWNNFKELCKTATPADMIDSPYSKLYARYMTFAGVVHNTFAKKEIIEGEFDNYWFYGNPGTGKTLTVWKEYGKSLYIKGLNKWWDGYRNEETVLLDDWDPNYHGLAQLLKTWSDRYPFRAEAKGTTYMLRPKRIIVTSNYKIEQCFENIQDINAFKRRFKIVHFINFGETEIE